MHDCLTYCGLMVGKPVHQKKVNYPRYHQREILCLLVPNNCLPGIRIGRRSVVLDLDICYLVILRPPTAILTILEVVIEMVLFLLHNWFIFLIQYLENELPVVKPTQIKRIILLSILAILIAIANNCIIVGLLSILVKHSHTAARIGLHCLVAALGILGQG